MKQLTPSEFYYVKSYHNVSIFAGSVMIEARYYYINLVALQNEYDSEFLTDWIGLN